MWKKIVVGILLCFIFVCLGIGLFNKRTDKKNITYLNPLEDEREYSSLPSILEEDLPSYIRDTKNIIEKQLEEACISHDMKDFSIVNIQNVLNSYKQYNLKNLVLTEDKSKKKLSFIIFMRDTGDIARIQLNFKDQPKELVLQFNQSLVEVLILSMEKERQEEITNTLSTKYDSPGWSLGSIYLTYENVTNNKLRIFDYYF